MEAFKAEVSGLYGDIIIILNKHGVNVRGHNVDAAEFHELLYIKMFKRVSSPDVMLKLSGNNNQDVSTLREQLDKTTLAISNDGMKLVESYIHTNAGAVVSYECLLQHELLSLSVANAISSGVIGWIATWLAKDISEINIKISKCQSTLVSLERGMNNVQREIVLTNGLPFELDQIENVRKEAQSLSFKKYQLELVYNFFKSQIRPDHGASFWIDSLVPNMFLSYEIITKVESKESEVSKTQIISSITSKILPLFTAVYGVNEYSAWGGDNAQELRSVRVAIANLTMLQDLAAKKDEGKDVVYRVNKSQDALLAVKDFHLTLNGDSLVDIPDLEFNPGIYAITGKSGSGKTTAVTVMAGYKNIGVMSSGTIAWQVDAKTVFVTQKDYFPTESTLY